MWKAISLALGISLVIAGIELFFVDEIEVRKITRTTSAQSFGQPGGYQNASWAAPSTSNPGAKTFLYRPRDWMPWSLLATGSVIVIYTFTLSSRRE